MPTTRNAYEIIANPHGDTTLFSSRFGPGGVRSASVVLSESGEPAAFSADFLRTHNPT
jgi:hypothetical protein